MIRPIFYYFAIVPLGLGFVSVIDGAITNAFALYFVGIILCLIGNIIQADRDEDRRRFFERELYNRLEELDGKVKSIIDIQNRD